MPYVYILSTYDEHGAENVVASLSESGIFALAEQHFPKAFGEYERRELEAMLQETDGALRLMGGINLSEDWGGLMLHVVLLDSEPGRSNP